MIFIFSNQTKAETNNNFISFLAKMFASSNTFKCKFCVRSEKKATDQVKTGRNLLLEKDHLLCQEIKRPEAWKNGEESPRKRCWQFVNSQGIFREHHAKSSKQPEASPPNLEQKTSGGKKLFKTKKRNFFISTV